MKERDSKFRLEQMLDKDKEDMNEETKLAALADFKRFASEYFDLLGDAVFTIKRVKGCYEAVFSLRAARVKNFSLLR